MRRLVFALLLGLVFVPFPLHAQTVTLTVCNMGKVDIDVFVSQAGTHIRPATCTVVAASSGAMEPAYVGLAFADARASWVPPGGSTAFLPWGSRTSPWRPG